jgi:hypothetical protein
MYTFRKLLVWTGLASSIALNALAQGTAFTYQGRLNIGSNPANGLYDLQFGIYDAPTFGNEQGGFVTTNATAVSNGLFTVTLDFGPGIFTGPARWLDISVRTNNGFSFVTLTPRQALTATPYSILSANATSAQSVLAGNISGTLSPGQLPAGIVTNGSSGVSVSGTFSGNLTGNVGIGTNNPGLNNVQINPTFFSANGYGLVVDRADFGENIQINRSAGQVGIGLAVDDAVVPNSSTSMLLVRDNVATSPQTLFDILGNGNVGIGTNNPQAALHVVGNILATGTISGSINAAQLTSIGNTNGGGGNFFVGPSGNVTNSGSGNTGIGVNTLNSNTSGSNNTAVGNAALAANTNGSYNTAVGLGALVFNTSGSQNTAYGYDALALNSGSANIALGSQAGIGILSGSSNIDIGNPGLSTDANLIRIGSGQTQTYIAGVINGDGGGLSNVVASAAQLTSIGNTNGGQGNFFVGPSGNATNSGSYNTADGFGALNSNTSGSSNSAYGVSVLLNNTTGSFNTADGFQALFNNTNGFGNTADGFQALFSNLSGYLNTADGFQALWMNSTGSYNTADGTYALYFNNIGSYNTATGFNALAFNADGSYNVASGVGALYSNTGGSENTAVGVDALANNSDGFANTAIGVQALEGNTTGSNNISLGYQAGINNPSGNSNIDIGNIGDPGDNNTIRIGDHQSQTYIAGVIHGDGSGLYNINVSVTNISAAQLTSIGNTNNSTANFFVGPSGNATTSGSYNTADGNQAFVSNTSGSVNAAFGVFALNNNTAGSENTASGVGALYANTSGSFNTADGYDALSGSSGSFNIGLGALAGQNITTGSNNIDIGNPGLSTDTNIIRIGTTQTATILAGNLGIGTNNPGPNNLQINPTFFGDSGYGLVVCQTDYAEEIQMDHQRGVLGGVGLTVDDAHIPDASTAMLMVRTNVANTAQTLFIVQGNGNVGIGTNSAANPLQMGSGAYCSVGGTWTSSSDRNAKQDFAVVSTRDVLDKVAAMPITEWQYKAEPDGIRHIGPMAQDFHEAFGLNGSDDTHISTVDEGGVALAAIQGLNEKVDGGSERVEGRMQKLENENQKLEHENAELKARLEKLEKLVGARDKE